MTQTTYRLLPHWIILAMLVLGCAHKPNSESLQQSAPQPIPSFKFTPSRRIQHSTGNPSPASCGILFVDVATEVGLQHQYKNGAEGRMLMPEAMGGGWAWLDFDGDWLPDAFLTQGFARLSMRSEDRPPDRLFRNIEGDVFSPVNELICVNDLGYGQGCSSADYDSDGFSDLYVTNQGGNVLLRNLGDGTFADMTKFAGVIDGRWSTSAAWCDLDLDGDLDLYVCNYLQYNLLAPPRCDKDDKPAMCHPRSVARGDTQPD